MNGFAPQYTATTDSSRYTFKSENSETVKKGIKWTGSATGDLAVSDSKFNNENDYTVSIKLVAQDGYTFANNVAATINANNANVSVESDTEIRISYTFPKPEKTKWYVTFSNPGGYASGDMQPVQVEEGEYTLLEPTYTPNTGFAFEGWVVNGLLKQPGDKITVTSNTYLEARWISTVDYNAPHGFTKQPADASDIVGMQIQYAVDNFTIDPSITYEHVFAEIYNAETGEWVTTIDGVSAGNGIIENYGQQMIVFNSSIAGEFTFRLRATKSGTTVAISESFTVTWSAKKFTTQPQGDMVVVGNTVTVVANKNFADNRIVIEYKDGEEWKLYQSLDGFGWDDFSFGFTSDTAKSVTYRLKAYADVFDIDQDQWIEGLIDTSEEFTITWTSNEHVHTYGAIPNGKDETNHWKECTNPACPDKAHSKIEVEAHKDNGADNKCDVCGYDLPVPEYVVSYNENGGSGTMVGDVIEKGGTFTLEACTYTAPEGKKFKAWAIGSANGEQKQPNEQIIITAETYIYAIWEDIPVANYTVSFNANGGSEYESKLSLYGLNESNKQLIIEDYFNGFTFYNLVFEKGNLTIENTSGNTDSVGSFGWKNKFKLNGELTIRGNTLVYLWLGATGYNYDVNNIIEVGTLKLLGNSSLYYTAEVSDDVYAIVSANRLVLDTDGELYLDAEDAGGVEKVLYINDITLSKCKSITLASPNGYDENLTNSKYLRNAVTTPIPGYYASITQYGDTYDGYRKTYRLISDSLYFTVSFYENGGTGTMDPVENVQGYYVLPECTLVPPKYDVDLEFQCWTDKSYGGSNYAEGSSFFLYSDVKFYAKWKIASDHIVSFDANGGSGSMTGGSYKGGYALPACSFTAPSGKQFKCWALGSASGMQFDTDATYYLYKDVTFYAIWEDIAVTEYNVTYSDNGGNGTMVGDVVEAGGTFTLENCTYEAPEGKQFKGWAVGAVNATPLKQAGEQITITADTIIYAIWEDLPAHTHTDTDGQWESNGRYHWHTCSCTEEFDKVEHSGGTATCTEKAVCSVCNAAYGNTAAHNHGTEWQKNADEHWNECECGDKANKAAHADTDNNGKCDTCEYQMSTIPDNPDNPDDTPDNPDDTPDNPNNTPDNPNNTPDDPTDDKDGLGAGAIVGIVIGSVAVVGVGGFALFWFVIKKKTWAEFLAIFKKK